MTAKKTSVGKWIALVVAIIFMFATHFITPPTGLSQAGLQVLGILVGAIILFLSWGTGWPSMAVVFAMMTVPDMTVAKVTQSTFGNNTVVFLLFCFMLAACLTKSGAARRIAVWFLTNKLARKSPWWTIAMYLLANFVLSFVLSSAATIMIMLPIAIEIFESVGLKKEDQHPLVVAVLLGTLATASFANGANPISHAVAIQGFSFFESFTGTAMDFFEYCAICTPIAIVASLLFFAMVKFVWRPNVSVLTSINYEALSASCGKMTKKEKWSVVIYIICVIFWVLPGLSKYVWPSAYPFLNKINNCIPPLVALFFMNLVKVDGEPILDWNDAVKAVSWPTFMFIAAIMGLGSFMGNADIGISAWLSDLLGPAFANVSPIMFLFIMVLLVNLITNFCSNSVSLSIVFAIAVPLAMTVYADSLSTVLVAAVVTSGAMNGLCTPPASPNAAVVYGSGWVNTKSMIKWGMAASFIHVLVATFLGLAIGSGF